jgi:hypothetical protein
MFRLSLSKKVPKTTSLSCGPKRSSLGRHSEWSGTCRFHSHFWFHPSRDLCEVGNFLWCHTSGPAISSGPQIHPVWPPTGVETRDLGRDLGAGCGADSWTPSSDPSLNWGLEVPRWRSNWLIRSARAKASSTTFSFGCCPRLPAGILWVLARSLILENRSKKSIDSSLIVLLEK